MGFVFSHWGSSVVVSRPLPSSFRQLLGRRHYYLAVVVTLRRAHVLSCWQLLGWDRSGLSAVVTPVQLHTSYLRLALTRRHSDLIEPLEAQLLCLGGCYRFHLLSQMRHHCWLVQPRLVR